MIIENCFIVGRRLVVICLNNVNLLLVIMFYFIIFVVDDFVNVDGRSVEGSVSFGDEVVGIDFFVVFLKIGLVN